MPPPHTPARLAAPRLRADGADPADSADSADSAAEADERRLTALLTTAFLALLAGALLRYVLRHGDSGRLPWVVALSVVLAGTQLVRGGSARARRARLGVVAVCWAVVVLLAPSFAWCAIPLVHTALRVLPVRAALAAITALTALVVVAELRLADGFDPNLVLLPPVVAALATGVFLHLSRESERRGALIDDLVRTRRELAATERREGTLAERQRLSGEIHDTLAQGLSSQRMLLQAAERQWDRDPAAARAHVSTAASIAAEGLAEARRLVHDLGPAGLAGGTDLGAALTALAARSSRDGLVVRAEVHDETGAGPGVLPDRVASALLRTAQGALANVREHARARTATLTLTLLDDLAFLDVADDGRGFVPDPGAEPRGPRGHGLPATRARLQQLGGTLAVESAPGEGTVLTARVPLHEPPGAAAAERTFSTGPDEGPLS